MRATAKQVSHVASWPDCGRDVQAESPRWARCGARVVAQMRLVRLVWPVRLERPVSGSIRQLRIERPDWMLRLVKLSHPITNNAD